MSSDTQKPESAKQPPAKPEKADKPRDTESASYDFRQRNQLKRGR